jgi:hypothetical protein
MFSGVVNNVHATTDTTLDLYIFKTGETIAGQPERARHKGETIRSGGAPLPIRKFSLEPSGHIIAVAGASSSLIASFSILEYDAA